MYWLVGIVFLLSIWRCDAAELDQPLTLLTSPYSESYLANPVVTGNLLVGLHFGTADGPFDPTSVSFAISRSMAGLTGCIDIASKDGRYTAENLYRLPDPPALRAHFVYDNREGPLITRKLTNSDIAIKVRLVSSCDIAEQGIIVPVRLGRVDAKTGLDELVLAVNADPDRLSVRLNTVPPVIGSCRDAGSGARIAFSAICTIMLPKLPAAEYGLTLAVRERFKPVETTYRLRLGAD